MAERWIVGVDFSGAKADKRTWITEGSVNSVNTDNTEGSSDSGKGALLLLSCRSVPREKLARLLKALPGDAVAALDFPFSVPMAFAEFLGHPNKEMPDLWQAAAAMEREEFFAKCDRFVKEYGELLRAGDLHVPGCTSCLHRGGNPNMVPMTFHGMQMLSVLWKSGSRVPPLENPGHKGAVLLEVMPGAALKAFGLPDKGYKKESRQSIDNRRKILRELPKRSGVNVVNLRDFSDEAISSHDALDSIVAALTAALWIEEESAFRRPCNILTVEQSCANIQRLRRVSPEIKGMKQLAAAKREGWIYMPKPRIFKD